LVILLIAHTLKGICLLPLAGKWTFQGSKSFNQPKSISCFAVGESQKDPCVKNPEAIKVSIGAFEFSSENVLVCKIGKDTNFQLFSF